MVVSLLGGSILRELRRQNPRAKTSKALLKIIRRFFMLSSPFFVRRTTVLLAYRLSAGKESGTAQSSSKEIWRHVAHDPVQAEAQHASELKKGQNTMECEKTRDQVLRNLAVLKRLGWSAPTLAGPGITKEIWDLL
jgi:hypothetical protein